MLEEHEIVRFVKAKNIRWLGPVEEMSEKGMPKRMLKRLFSRRRTGRPRTRWSDNVVICGGDGGQRLEREIIELIRMEKSCGGGQSPPRAVQLMMENNPATEFTGRQIKTGKMIHFNFDEKITVHMPVIQIHSIKYSVLLQIKQWYTY
jgi:hypothetical protein